MEGDDVLPVCGGSPSGICEGSGCRGHGALWREARSAANPTSGHTALGMEPRGPAWRVPARLGATPCPRWLAKITDSSF